MNCNEYQEQASLLLDSELDNLNQRQLFKHLSECSTCQLFLDSVIRLRELKKNEILTFPTDIDDKLFARLNLHTPQTPRLPKQKESYPFFRRYFQIPMAAIFALVVMLFIVGYVLGMNAQKQESYFSLTGIRNPARGEQQPTVIFIYGLPEVHVMDSLPAKVVHKSNQTIF